jgi:hypothetical protein
VEESSDSSDFVLWGGGGSGCESLYLTYSNRMGSFRTESMEHEDMEATDPDSSLTKFINTFFVF